MPTKSRIFALVGSSKFEYRLCPEVKLVSPALKPAWPFPIGSEEQIPLRQEAQPKKAARCSLFTDFGCASSL